MKIAISASGSSLDEPFDPRFGRAANYIIIDSETEDAQAYPNPAVGASGGAGIQAAQFIAGHGVQAVISGNFGPNAFEALAAADINMYAAPAGDPLTVRQVLAAFQENQLKPVSAATGPALHGPGTGRGRGGGRGGGGGRGRQ